jgi:HEAT repeat protein
MVEDSEIPFLQVLDSLFAEDELPIHLLFRISDVSDTEMSLFKRRWPDVPDERRRIIVRHLADISEENYLVDFQPIFAICLKDPSAAVRLAALDGIWDATSSVLTSPVIDLLQTDESMEVRAAAASALAHFVLLTEWGQLPENVSPPIVKALLAEYENLENPNLVRRATLEALGASSHSRVPGLIREAYENDDPDIQLSAVFAMGSSADAYWLPTLFDEMSSHSVAMRAEAARAAGSIGDRSAVPELANLTIDEDLDVARAAVTALGQIGGDRAYGILVDLVDDPDLEAIQETVDEAINEMAWLDGSLDFLSPADDEFEEN